MMNKLFAPARFITQGLISTALIFGYATAKGRPLKLANNYAYADYISTQLHNGCSPDQVVGTLRRQNKWTVSTPTLYRYIDRDYIPDVTNSCLFTKKAKKRKYRKTQKAVKAPKGPSIEYRPKETLDRMDLGDWEMDCVVGKALGHDQTLLVLTERKTRYEIIRKLHRRTAAEVTKAVKTIVDQYPQGTFLTLTVDNGSEFQDYLGLVQLVNEVYYCHPYCSSERGSNENANRLIRRWLPKGTSFKSVTQSDCDIIQDRINSMPRKILGYATAQEMFDFELRYLIE